MLSAMELSTWDEPRSYQTELFNIAKDSNSIVYLGTGSGKTYIALMMIREFYKKRDSKKIVMVVPSLPLADQQKKVIEGHFGFLRVTKITGEENVDSWDSKDWQRSFGEYDIIVVIDQILYDSLCHSYVNLSDISLLIFDECHHAVKDNPYSKIMSDHYFRLKSFSSCVPQILGLSASLVVTAVNIEKFRIEKEKLESKLDSTVITTRDLDLFLRLCTKPEELFQEYIMSDPFLEVVTLLSVGLEKTEKIFTNKIIQAQSLLQNELVVLAVRRAKCVRKEFSRVLRETENILVNLGMHSSLDYAERLFKSVLPPLILNSTDDYEREIMSICSNTLELVMKRYQTVMSSFEGSPLEKMYSYTSPKVQALLNLIENLIKYKRVTELNLTALVFSKRREGCRSLCKLVSEIASLDPNFKFLRPGFTVGAASNGERSVFRTIMDEEMKKLSNTVNQFRSGRINLIFSTSVLEEGMDIRTCNLVVHFDEVETYRSYVQSKGRARLKPSYFVMMCPVSETRRIQSKVNEYKRVEKISIEECHCRPFGEMKSAEEQEENRESRDPPYLVNPSKPLESPTVTSYSAIPLLFRYIQSIPTDFFTTLLPYFKVEPVTVVPSNKFQRMIMDCSKKYICTLTLPTRSGVIDPIVGDPKMSKKGAKRNAALKACVFLHKRKKLSDNLLPVNKILEIEEEVGASELEEELDEDSESIFKDGSNQKRQYYFQNKPFISKEPVCQSPNVFIYVLNMRLVEESSYNPKRYFIYRPEDTLRKLGLCLGNPLPDSVVGHPIRLYSRSGLIEITISLVNHLVLNNDSIADLCGGVSVIKDWNRAIFDDVLNVVTPWMDEYSATEILSSRDPLVVPLVNNSIDVKFMKSVATKNSYNDGDWTGKVVRPRHKEESTRFFVEEIVREMSPQTMISASDTRTYADYYFSNYGLQIKNMEQPLIRVSNADASFSAYTSHTGKSDNNQDSKLFNLDRIDFLRTRNLFIPELVNIHPIPSSFWKDLQLLPFILERINHIENSFVLYKEIYQVEKKEHTTLSQFEFLTNFQDCGRFGSFDYLDILQSITLKGASEEFDLERNETLGDSFLKIAASLYLFFEILEDDEGFMTQCRSRIVGNRNLYHIGERKLCLGEKINAFKLTPKVNWRVPFYNNRDTLEKALADMDKAFRQEIFQKKIKVESSNFFDGVTDADMNELGSLLLKGIDVSGFYENIKNRLSSSRNEWEKQRITLKALRSIVPIANKCIADAVESIIGAYLVHNGCLETLKLMDRKMGLKLRPGVSLKEVLRSKMHSFEKDALSSDPWSWFTPPANAFIPGVAVNDQKLNYLLSSFNFEIIESTLGYRFKEKSFLIQSLTHASYITNNLTFSYERLEFLGDAVLDYVVTAYIYSNYPDFNPGSISDARSAVVNNVWLACLTVRAKLHCHFLYEEPEILSRIDAFIANMDLFDEEIQSDESKLMSVDFNCLLSETECPVKEEVEVPKVLGDILESILGAIFLDSGFDLHIVWNVFVRLCPEIESLITSKPKNFVATLYELYPSKVTFSSTKKTANFKTEKLVSLDLGNGKVYNARGIGLNKKAAKRSAAKCLLRELSKLGFISHDYSKVLN